MKYSQYQPVKNISLHLLRKLGNKSPSQQQIKLMEMALSHVTVIQEVTFTTQLTRQENSCLYWAAMGKTSHETAKLLDIRPYTVEQHRKEIKKKLRCKTIAQVSIP